MGKRHCAEGADDPHAASSSCSLSPPPTAILCAAAYRLHADGRRGHARPGRTAERANQPKNRSTHRHQHSTMRTL
eukprot:scaffold2340_cov113-Isochrysis_galbana.AAC.3